MNCNAMASQPIRWLLLATSAAMLVACGEEDKTAVSYTAYNHTDLGVGSIIINGEGGILNARAHGGGSEMCCVVIPTEWRPGLKATIKWQEDGHWVRDGNGNIVVKDGRNQFVEGAWRETVVDIPRYSKPLGNLRIHFLPAGEVRAVVSFYGPTHPDYPIRFPSEQESPAGSPQ
ncbi:DUF3304 domain-containing protein [Rubrivivax gelatinosus]|nr:DUF3304 domain-containing protein [Rubrivivax gelatinosus]